MPKHLTWAKSFSKSAMHLLHKGLLIVPPCLPLALVIGLALGVIGISVPEEHVDSYQVRSVFPVAWKPFLKDFFDPEGLFGGFQAPLYFIIAKLYGSIFGDSTISLRMLSVIAFCGLIALTGTAIPLLKLGRDKWVSTWFIFMIATSPAYIWWAQTAKYNMWFYWISVASLISGVLLLQHPSLPSIVLFCITTGAALYTHYFAFVIALSQFLILILISVFRKDRQLLQSVLICGLVVLILISPLLPTLLSATQARQQEQYHFSEQGINVMDLVRGFFFEWNFSYPLNLNHGLLLQLMQVFAIYQRDGFLQALKSIQGYAFQLIAIITLSLSLFQVILILRRKPGLAYIAGYIGGVPLLSIAISLAIKFALRFNYLGLGTWSTYAVLAIGWHNYRRRRSLIIAMGALLWILQMLSLKNYYTHLDLKYPGMKVVVDHFKSQPSQCESVFIDSWIKDVRGSRSSSLLMMPSNLKVQMISKIEEIQLPEPHQKCVDVVLSGRREVAVSQLASFISEQGNYCCHLVESWPSMEIPERSIHIFRVETLPCDQVKDCN